MKFDVTGGKKRITLLILAAGVGSRYGGLKQLEKIGPNGECIMDYSIYDAIRAGFTKILLVINQDFEDVFIEQIVNKWRHSVDINYIFQEHDHLSKRSQLYPPRKKPWGTGHAILVAKDKIKEPFVVINADDFYGQQAFELIAHELSKDSDSSNEYCLVAYQLKNTLSEYGFVSRGLCTLENNRLTSIKEYTEISLKQGQIIYSQNGEDHVLSGSSLVSMNFWGFTPYVFEFLETSFSQFIAEHANHPIAEFFIAYPIDAGIKNKTIEIKVITTNEKWMGVTYQNDREFVKNRLRQMISLRQYPSQLIGTSG